MLFYEHAGHVVEIYCGLFPRVLYPNRALYLFREPPCVPLPRPQLGSVDEDESEAGNGEDSGGDQDEEEDSEPSAAESGGGDESAKRPMAPLFAFPPGPRVDRTKAEESLQVM